MTLSVGVPRTAKARSSTCAHAQRLVQGQRVAGARLVGLGRHHPHVVAELAGDLAQRVQAGRIDAVVVGEEDAHGALYRAKFDAVAMRGSRE